MSFNARFSSARALSQLPWRSCARAAAVNASAAVPWRRRCRRRARGRARRPACRRLRGPCCFREEQALTGRDEHVLAEADTFGMDHRLVEERTRALVVAEQHLGDAVDEQRRGLPVASFGQERNRKTRVGEHRADPPRGTAPPGGWRSAPSARDRRPRNLPQRSGNARPARSTRAGHEGEPLARRASGGEPVRRRQLLEPRLTCFRGRGWTPETRSARRSALPVGVAGRQRVLQRRLGVAVRQEPMGGAAAELLESSGSVSRSCRHSSSRRRR